MSRRVVILRDHVRLPEVPEGFELLPFRELRRQILDGPLSHLFRYREARLVTYRLQHMSKPFNTALLLRLLSRGRCQLNDEANHRQRVTTGLLARLLTRLVRDYARRPRLLRRVQRDIAALESSLPARSRRLPKEGLPVYLRTDLVFGVQSGGSVGHIAGVLNHLEELAGQPVFLSSDRIPTVRPEIETHIITPRSAYWDFQELPRLYFNQTFIAKARQALRDRQPAFFYQRYSINNYAAVMLAQQYGVPLVTEYNGPEVWLHRHWGEPLPRRLEELAARIELLNLRAAELVVVVSAALKKELLGRRIEDQKILVNPNGVNPEVYSPAIDGSAVRRRLGLHGKTVIGFIGTFGRWHGVEVLADAFGRLLEQFPEYRPHVRLLLIGDGMTMSEVRTNLARRQATDAAIFTGLVPQEEGPAHLAACDFLVSPHVPNPDGSEFFGSPTKLFEYMAMGKGIVASDLAQIGEVLAHERTALLVQPGDTDALVVGMKRMLDEPALRQRLGEAARREVLGRYTWKEHTRKILNALHARCGGGD